MKKREFLEWAKLPICRAIFTIFCGALSLVFAMAAKAAERQELHGHVPTAVTTLNLQPMGRLPSTNRLHLAIGLPLRNQEALTILLQQIYDPTSPQYRHYLTPEQFTEMFGPTEADYQALINFAKANGLDAATTHGSRMLLDVRGQVSDVERAFHVTLRTYQHPTEPRNFFAPDVEPSVDSSVPILDISGLSDYAILRPMLHRRPITENAYPASGSGPYKYYIGRDFRNAYVPGVSLTGTGQIVGLFEAEGYYLADITNYENLAGLPNVPLQNVLVDGFSGIPNNTDTDGVAEVSLDIELAISMAPGLSELVVFEGTNNVSNWLDILDSMASNTQIQQLSSSWGYTGSPNPNTSFDNLFQKMAAQGQSFFQASGDGDAWVNPIWVPAASPYVTSVGGTTLMMNGSGASYASETVWNWGYLPPPHSPWFGNGNGYWGSGGGTSSVYAIPSWQQGVNMSVNQGSTTMRNIPDVAMTADGIWVIYLNGQSNYFGGTSCAAPLWAGFTALVNQQATANGAASVGFLNPALYTIGQGSSYTSAFHDVTVGSNEWSGSLTHYTATNGYDLCTGLGSPNGAGLINGLLSGRITLSSPSGGGGYRCGQNLYINWSWYGAVGTYVNIVLLKGGVYTNTIAASTFNSGFYTWPIPLNQPLGNDYQVRIYSTSTAAAAQSANFTIAAYVPPPTTNQISSLSDLQAMSLQWGTANYPVDGYYILTSDIDATDTINWDSGKGFKPIGNGSSDAFRGVFDGQGHTIAGLQIVRTNEPYAALFKVTMDNAVIKNLTVQYKDCKGEGYLNRGGTASGGVGGIAGWNSGTIQNCHVSVSPGYYMWTTNGDYVGGIVGANDHGTILNCSVYGTNGLTVIEAKVPALGKAGGIAGFNNGLIRWCWVEQSVQVNGYVGSSPGSDVGGIAGDNYGGRVIECGSWAGYVHGYDNLGGVAGHNESGGEIDDCYFTGGVSCVDLRNGGIVGYNESGTANRCYVSGSVSGGYPLRGSLIGENDGLVENSYWNTDTVTWPATGNGSGVINCSGKTTAQLRQQATFPGWDFSNVWSIAEGSDFPRLRGMGYALAAPTNLTTSSGLADGVHIAWSPVAGAGFYRVYRSDATNGTVQALSTNWLAGITFLDTNASPNTTYYYWVDAASTPGGGRESGFSAYATGSRTPPPVAVPQNVVASKGLASHVLVTWSPVTNANYYQVYRSDTLTGAKSTLSPWQADASFSDGSGNPGTTYYYWVKAALDSAGGSASDFSVPDTGYFTSVDSIGDGIPDWWRAHYFGGSGTNTNSVSCAACDADGTGQNNLFKYIAGLDPTNPVSVFSLNICLAWLSPSLSDGLVAYYPLDGDANDTTTNGNNGALIGSTYFIPGVVGDAVHLQGQGCVGEAGGHVSIPFFSFPSMPQFSISLWVKEEGLVACNDGEAYIFWGNNSGGYGGQVLIGHFNGCGAGCVSFCVSGSTCVSAPFLPSFTSNWVHYALVYDNGTLHAYTNGTLTGTASGSVSVTQTNGGLGIHWFNSGGTVSTRFIGAIDDVRIYNRALTATEVQQLYQATSPALVYGPSAAGRTYTPQFTTNLTLGNWSPLTGYAGPVTNGSQATITDTNAVGPQRFYRIDISLP